MASDNEVVLLHYGRGKLIVNLCYSLANLAASAIGWKSKENCLGRLFIRPGQSCESFFINATKFSSSSKKSVDLLEISSLSSVPLYKTFRKIGTKFSSSSKRWAELQELSSLN